MRKTVLGVLVTLAFVPARLFAQDPSIVERCYLGAINDVALAADEIGKLKEVLVSDGDAVALGDVIAQIDDDDAKMAREVAKFKYIAAFKQAKSDVSVRAAQKAQAFARTAYDQILSANERKPGTYTDLEVEKAKLDWERSGLQIDLATHEMEVASAEAYAANAQLIQSVAMIERRKLKAPFGGVVNQVIREPGEWVNAGDPVVHLVQMDRLRVHGRIDADRFDWKAIRNRPVEVTVHLPGGGTHVVNSQIGFASQVVEDDGAFRVWAEIENTQEGNGWLMGPGLAATLQLR